MHSLPRAATTHSLFTNSRSRSTRFRRALTAPLTAMALVLGSRAAWADPSWISPACADTGLESPAGTCDGPWRYSWQQTCSDPAICGYSTACQTYNTCSSYQVGITQSSVTENPSGTYTYTCTTISTNAPEYDNGTPACTTPTPTAKCASIAAARKSAILATVPTTAPGYATWAASFGV